MKMECNDSKHREASNPSQFCTGIRGWCLAWHGGHRFGEVGAAALPRLLLCHMMLCTVPCSHCSCLPAVYHSHLPSSCITFILV